MSFTIDNLEDYGLKDGENIYIRKYPVRKVSIQGAVNNPGIQFLKGSFNDIW